MVSEVPGKILEIPGVSEGHQRPPEILGDGGGGVQMKESSIGGGGIEIFLSHTLRFFFF